MSLDTEDLEKIEKIINKNVKQYIKPVSVKVGMILKRQDRVDRRNNLQDERYNELRKDMTVDIVKNKIDIERNKTILKRGTLFLTLLGGALGVLFKR